MTTKNFSVKTEFNAVDHMSSKIRRMESGVARFTSRAISGMGALQNVTGKIDSAIRKVGTTIGVLGTAAGFVAKSVIGAGGDFDQQMADLGAVSLKTRDQIKPLEDQAKALGATTKFTATQVGQGMELMAKAGFSTTDIMSGITGVLSAAAAEGAELAETSGHISNVLKGMGLATSEAGHVADVLALAAARTNSTIGSLGESMANVASTARTFNIPLEQVVASVAMLQDVGLDASVAGSAMNTMLTKLAAPTDDMAGKMRKMGVRFQDAKGNMLPLQEVLQNFAKAMDKSGGNMKQVAFFADLVGLRGQKAAQNLADMIKPGEDGQSKLVKLMEELSHASDGVGKATEMADLRMKGFHGRMDLLTSAVDAVKVKLFDMNSGPLKGLIDSTTKWVETNQDLIVSKVQEWVTWLIDNFDLLVERMKTIGKAILVFYALNTALKVVKFTFEVFQLGVKAWPVVAKVARWATKWLTMEVQGFGLKTSVATTQLGAFNTQTAVAATGVGKLQGAFGLLGGALTALFLGWEIGRWISDVFDLDKKISDLLLKIQGVDVDARNGEQGGSIHKKGGKATQEFIAKHGVRGAVIAPVEQPKFVPFPSIFGHHPVTPLSGVPAENVGLRQPREQRSMVEIVVHDKSGGNVEIKPAPKVEGVNILLKPSGAF